MLAWRPLSTPDEPEITPELHRHSGRYAGEMALKYEPDFGPGAGWHRDGEGWRIPGCEADILDRRSRAWECVVMPVRERGERIDSERLRNMQPIAGGLLMMGSVVDGREQWTATLFQHPAMTHPIIALHEAVLRRVVNGCRQYAGLEKEGHRPPRWPQTWICAPTRAELDAIVDRMAERLWR